jgi:hypothetical protein
VVIIATGMSNYELWENPWSSNSILGKGN